MRPQRPHKRPEPGRHPPEPDRPSSIEDEDDGTASAVKPGQQGERRLAALSRAVAAVHQSRPAPEDGLKVARVERYKPGMDLTCWNGQRSDRPHCGPAGSQNICFLAETVLGNWLWVAATAHLERPVRMLNPVNGQPGGGEGLFGREIGSDSLLYYRDVLRCKVIARMRLTEAKREAEAEDCRLAIRAAIALDALIAVPAKRKVYILNAAGRTITLNDNNPSNPDMMVAIAGVRYTVRVERTNTPREIAHSIVLADAMRDPEKWAIRREEHALLERTIYGVDPVAARQVAEWTFGTIDNPDARWDLRCRRLDTGAETVFGHEWPVWPSSYKPLCAVTQAKGDGEMYGMKPSPYKMGNWGAAEFETIIGDDGVIRSKCGTGSAEIRELAGQVQWQLDIIGQRRIFNGVEL